jgi:tartrate dehydrogenase/decarboxylase / D-malate dehydrogenase
MASSKIAVIELHGIGKEVMPEGIRAKEAAARRFGLDLLWERLDWGCDDHARFGRTIEPKVAAHG